MILIIGLGNPLWGDHGVGKVVVDRVVQNFPQGKAETGEDITAIARYQLSPELTVSIRSADKVIFVNTEISFTTGKIICRPLLEPPQPKPYSHDLSPAALLEGARVLYGKSPQATLVSLTSSHVDYRNSLSRAALSALPELLSLVYGLIDVEQAGNYVNRRYENVSGGDFVGAGTGRIA